MSARPEEGKKVEVAGKKGQTEGEALPYPFEV